MVQSLFLSILSFTAGYAITRFAIWYSRYRGLQDLPTHRSLHSQPTPRGGGIAIVIPALLVTAWVTHQWPLVLGSFMLAGVGWWDDHKSVDFRIRLFTQVVASGVVVSSVMSSFNPVSCAALTLFLMWMTNLYNFMDGIDGLASSEGVFIAGGCAVLSLLHGDQPVFLAFLATACAAGALTLLNWQPAKIFMGDVGSYFLGFFLAALALKGSFAISSFLILAGVFVVDATITLLARAYRGVKLYEAHRDHAYQHAVLGGHSHAQVVKWIQCFNLLWLAPLAYLADRYPSYALELVAIAYLPLFLVALRLRAGRSLTA